MSTDLAGAVARALQRVALPLATYYGVTVGVPIANGAVLSERFVRHTLVVVLVPVALVTLLSAVWTGSRAVMITKDTKDTKGTEDRKRREP